MESEKKKSNFFKRFFNWLFQDSKRDMERLAKYHKKRFEVDNEVTRFRRSNIHRGL